MRKLLIALPLTFLCAAVQAAPADMAALRAYALRALPKCPGAVVTIEPVGQQGPINFSAFDVRLKSSDEGCSTRRFMLYSPASQQVIIGTIMLLPADGRPADARITEHATKLLNAQVSATVAPFPLQDGIKAVVITKQTQYGPFAYHAYVDASERFLIVGTRGTLRTDPGASLREALNTRSGVRRGNPKAKVEIIELSDFECPTCGRMHKKVEPLIVKNLNKINYTRLDLPLFEHHEWAIAAALGAHAVQKVAPAKYWKYVDYIYANQETIGKMAFDKVIQEWCEDNDVPWAKVKPLYQSTAERQAILELVSRAFDAGINATPTYIVNGQVLGFAKEGDFIVGEIKAALGVK